MKEKLKIAVLASGRGSNLQAIIDAIAAGELAAEIVLVFSDQPDSHALKRAAAADILCKALPAKGFVDREAYDAELAAIIDESGAHLVVLAGFMRILSERFLAAFPDKVINIHPSLLPAFPGIHGQKQAIDHGVKISGCTVHFVDTGMDTGAIIAQRAVPVWEDDDEDALSARILIEEHKLLPFVIGLFAEDSIRREGRKVIIL
jgi:phosphoribosylglycinamide formyltransferase-1